MYCKQMSLQEEFFINHWAKTRNISIDSARNHLAQMPIELKQTVISLLRTSLGFKKDLDSQEFFDAHINFKNKE